MYVHHPRESLARSGMPSEQRLHISLSLAVLSTNLFFALDIFEETRLNLSVKSCLSVCVLKETSPPRLTGKRVSRQARCGGLGGEARYGRHLYGQREKESGWFDDSAVSACDLLSSFT